MIHFRGVDHGIGYIIMCQIFIAFAGGTNVIPGRVLLKIAAQTAYPIAPPTLWNRLTRQRAMGIPSRLMILGSGLMIHFRGVDHGIGYIIMCQIFIAFAGDDTDDHTPEARANVVYLSHVSSVPDVEVVNYVKDHHLQD
jgi:hypothetical protein